MDPNVYQFFKALVVDRFQLSTTDEIESKTAELYDDFALYLVKEFQNRAHMNKQQLEDFEANYSDKNADTVLEFLSKVVAANLDQDLDDILLDILDQFVAEKF